MQKTHWQASLGRDAPAGADAAPSSLFDGKRKLLLQAFQLIGHQVGRGCNEPPPPTQVATATEHRITSGCFAGRRSTAADWRGPQAPPRGTRNAPPESWEEVI